MDQTHADTPQLSCSYIPLPASETRVPWCRVCAWPPSGALRTCTQGQPFLHPWCHGPSAWVSPHSYVALSAAVPWDLGQGFRQGGEVTRVGTRRGIRALMRRDTRESAPCVSGPCLVRRPEEGVLVYKGDPAGPRPWTSSLQEYDKQPRAVRGTNDRDPKMLASQGGNALGHEPQGPQPRPRRKAASPGPLLVRDAALRARWPWGVPEPSLAGTVLARGRRGLGVVPPDLHPGLRRLAEGQRQSSRAPWCRARSASWEGAGVQTPEGDPGCPARFWLQKESLYPWGVPQATCARTRAVGIEATHGLRRRAAGGVRNARIAIRALRVCVRAVRGADASEEGAYASRNLSLKGRPVPSADAPQVLSTASRRDAPALGFAGRTFLKFKLRLSIQACALSQRCYVTFLCLFRGPCPRH